MNVDVEHEEWVNPNRGANVRRRLNEDDPFFEDGDRLCNIPVRQTLIINVDDGDDTTRTPGEFVCSESGCKQIFGSVTAFDTHYNVCHRHECSDCRRRFPTSHLLEIHILENHDAHFQAMAVQQPIYRCLLENCPVKSWDAAERRQHTINDHHFPANFRFYDQRRPMSSTEKMQVEEAPSESKPVGKPKVPKNVCFGRGSTRGFHRGNRGKLSVKELQHAIDEI